MTIDEIAALPVAPLAADACVLFLWGTWPHLPAALAVIDAWGFTYKTGAFDWIKQNSDGTGLHTGMGYWTRSNSEFVLLATKGEPMRLAADVHQVVMAPVGEHSAKPEEVRCRIERLVAGPYLELFARRVVPGWTCWGNEISRVKE
jgi:N6-adenosine-specific RNA methylase IME4